VCAAAEGEAGEAAEGILTPDTVVKDEFFEVEKLLGVRASLEGEDPVVEYRVKWKDGRADTWCAPRAAAGAPRSIQRARAPLHQASAPSATRPAAASLPPAPLSRAARPMRACSAGASPCAPCGPASTPPAPSARAPRRRELASNISPDLVREFDDRWWNAARKGDEAAMRDMLRYSRDLLPQVVDDNGRR
jgi:hypothetical protein